MAQVPAPEIEGFRGSQRFPEVPVCGSVCGANRPADPREAVHFDVFGQVVAAGELLLAHLTLVGFDTRVGPPMSGQLVRSGEPAGRSFGFSKNYRDDDRSQELYIPTPGKIIKRLIVFNANDS